MGKYDDIINLPHHESAKHKRMSAENRAAQFAAFAALSGYGDMVDEKAEEVRGEYENEYGTADGNV